MIELKEVFETNDMVLHENLDVRTITMGISLLDCIDPDLDRLCEKIYDKIATYAKDLVKVGDDIGLEYGVPSSTRGYPSPLRPSSEERHASRPRTS